jgi:tripeptide aminopeptidase
MIFMKNLAEELTEMGCSDVDLDESGYLMATIPANISEHVPVIGFIAHVDTSPDFPGENVQPQIIEKYTGEAILLKNNISVDPAEFPEILKFVGQSIITADGTTLLGADDKAGVAEIVTAAEVLLNSPEIKHGKIRLGFTPDEEIGRGADRFDVAKFGADFAYTIDGGEIGELEYENFNAATAKITVTGKSIHPGYAKNKMVNAIWVAQRFISMLPAHEKPEYTEGYEGFFHVNLMKGSVEKAEIQILIRDHENLEFQSRKRRVVEISGKLNSIFGYPAVQVEITDSYFNMKEKIEPVMHIVERAKKAMLDSGIEPKLKPVRGGTDGARLSYMGLPCPNIFAGGHNFHGPYEYIPIPSMLKAVEVIVRIAAVNSA